MTTIALKNQRGSLCGPLPTRDAVSSGRYYTVARVVDDDAAEVTGALAVLQTAGLLDAEDLAKLRKKLARFGSPSATTTTAGVSTDARRVADARAQFLAETSHNRAVAKRRNEFWAAANAERADSITR